MPHLAVNENPFEMAQSWDSVSRSWTIEWETNVHGAVSVPSMGRGNNMIDGLVWSDRQASSVLYCHRLIDSEHPDDV